MDGEQRRGLFAWLTNEDSQPAARASAEAERAAAGELLVPEALIGKGGMCEVHRALDVPFGRHVAMKVLDAKYASMPSEFERFQAEARLTARLEHPNIPPVHALGVDASGRPYFTMQLVKGRTLADLLVDPAFTPSDDAQLFKALQILLRACEAVSHAHSRGVVHCDLKPSNLMVGAHGSIYLMDWGIARLMATEGAATSQVLGTASYMPPEQAHGRLCEVDARSDVFGLGAILYRILTGRPPYVGETVDELLAQARAAQVPAAHLTGTGPRAPRRLCDIATRALSADPAARHPSVVELREELERVLRGDAEGATITVPAGHVLLREGDVADAAYIVVEGELSVYRILAGERVELRRLGPGEAVGETAIFRQSTRTANVEAVTTSRVARVTKTYLDTEFARSPWVTRLAQHLADRFSETSDRVAHLTARTDELQLLFEFARHVATAGAGAEGWVAWTPARMRLARALKIPPGAVTPMVQRAAGIELDLEQDRVRLTPV